MPLTSPRERIRTASTQSLEDVVDIRRPAATTSPTLYASPHSGRQYPASFIKASKLDPVALRRSEDAFVDDLFGSVVEMGSPLIRALFPRAYVDPNREPWELDPGMFNARLPNFVNLDSPRAAAGLGTVARVVTTGSEIYYNKLDFPDIERRINDLYFPYHDTLKSMIDETLEAFGGCLLVDCHSMPSIGGPMDSDPGLTRTDVILGDRFGTSCASWITDLAEDLFRKEGFVVRRNRPYAGGFTTRHYGQPNRKIHALQIEVNRAIYMNEDSVTRLPAFDEVASRLKPVLEGLGSIAPEKL